MDDFTMTATPSLEDFAKSKSKLKSAANKLDLNSLEKLVASLSDILKSVKSGTAAKAEKKRLSKIKKISQLMAASGLSVDDFKAPGVAGVKSGKKIAAKKTGAKRPKVLPKYRLVIDGAEHLWSGRGRTPLVFSAHFAAGNSRESVEIQSGS
jgi:DNA-binding protein H-NS